MDDKWYYVMPPNINIMKCELGDKAMQYLWDCIESAKEDKKNVEYFSKQKEKDERRALALRLNLKRRKSQLRKRVGKEDG